MDKKGLCKLGRAIDHLSSVKPLRTALVTFVPYGMMHMIIQAFPDPFSFQFKILIKQRYFCPQVTHFGNTRQFLQGYIQKIHGNISGKNPLPILLFNYYSLQIKLVPFLKS